ncbi:MAG: response regulator [Pyrinomonadaceae bacterium]
MKTTILYLDDSDTLLRLFEQTFGGEYDIRTASKPADAFRMLDESEPDIVISDQRMPEIRGTEFLGHVAERHPSCYRVLLTGHATVGGTLREISSGVVEQFLAKPWTADTMRPALERAAISAAARRL